MIGPTHTAVGAWSGGRFIRFGEPIDEQRLTALFRRCYEDGIRTFVTTDVLGPTEGDRVLGEALADYPRDSYCLIAGIGHDFYDGKREGQGGFQRFTDPRLRGEDGYADFIREATERSLERCGVDRFDVMLLHNPDKRGYTSAAVWEDGMPSLKERGLADAIGIAPGPANGFVLDLIDNFERYGEQMDYAMVILNPFELWPMQFALPAAEKYDVKLISRVVDFGGVFHGDVRPGHKFPPMDHRAFRPGDWIGDGVARLDQMLPIAERNGLTPLQLACQWNLALPQVVTALPTLIQEMDNGQPARPIEEKAADLAATPVEQKLSEEEVAEIRRIGENRSLDQLKGATRQYQGRPRADSWPIDERLEDVAKRWEIDPDSDLLCKTDMRDLRERGARGQFADRRMYLQLQVLTGAEDAQLIADTVAASDVEGVVYADINDPKGVGVLTMSEDPAAFAGPVRDLLNSGPLAALELRPEFTMFGRTYGMGREPNLEDWLLEHPRRNAFKPENEWAVWYPLRRASGFHRLPPSEQGKILGEHARIGRMFGEAGYADDIRLECYGIDQQDNEFVLGLLGPRLDWLSKLVQAMRKTRQTAEFIDSLGPFFVGRRVDPRG